MSDSFNPQKFLTDNAYLDFMRKAAPKKFTNIQPFSSENDDAVNYLLGEANRRFKDMNRLVNRASTRTLEKFQITPVLKVYKVFENGQKVLLIRSNAALSEKQQKAYRASQNDSNKIPDFNQTFLSQFSWKRSPQNLGNLEMTKALESSMTIMLSSANALEEEKANKKQVESGLSAKLKDLLKASTSENKIIAEVYYEYKNIKNEPTLESALAGTKQILHLGLLDYEIIQSGEARSSRSITLNLTFTSGLIKEMELEDLKNPLDRVAKFEHKQLFEKLIDDGKIYSTELIRDSSKSQGFWFEKTSKPVKIFTGEESPVNDDFKTLTFFYFGDLLDIALKDFFNVNNRTILIGDTIINDKRFNLTEIPISVETYNVWYKNNFLKDENVGVKKYLESFSKLVEQVLTIGDSKQGKIRFENLVVSSKDGKDPIFDSKSKDSQTRNWVFINKLEDKIRKAFRKRSNRFHEYLVVYSTVGTPKEKEKFIVNPSKARRKGFLKDYKFEKFSIEGLREKRIIQVYEQTAKTPVLPSAFMLNLTFTNFAMNILPGTYIHFLKDKLTRRKDSHWKPETLNEIGIANFYFVTEVENSINFSESKAIINTNIKCYPGS